jgi:hypothetical protein
MLVYIVYDYSMWGTFASQVVYVFFNWCDSQGLINRFFLEIICMFHLLVCLYFTSFCLYGMCFVIIGHFFSCYTTFVCYLMYVSLVCYVLKLKFATFFCFIIPVIKCHFTAFVYLYCSLLTLLSKYPPAWSWYHGRCIVHFRRFPESMTIMLEHDLCCVLFFLSLYILCTIYFCL